jgi:hypothetical protein
MQARTLKILILIVVLLSFAHPAAAQAISQAGSDSATLDFPNTITFHAVLQSSVNISSVILEYGTSQSTCGDVIAKAFPQFTAGTSVQVEWTWDMRQSGSLPPGATIWWRWRYSDQSGKESVTEQKTVTWLDDVHDWQALDGGMLRLHWYGFDKTTANSMLQAGLDGLKFDDQQSGLQADTPIDLYVYPNYTDMQDAILYEPSWTGGMAYAEHNVVILGLSGSDSTWDKNTVVHELTHVLVGHLTFSCLTIMPTWLSEGLAVYSERGLDPASAAQLQDAIKNDKLLSVRSLSAGFSEVRDKVDLSYSQSYSIVKFLIETYGQDKMTSLLTTLKQGVSVDEALMDTYGFNVEGLEDAWRKAIGAAPRTAAAQPTSQPTPTFVPTIVPISAASSGGGGTPVPVPTSSYGQTTPTEQPGRGAGPPLLITLALIGSCCVFGLLAGVIILMVVLRSSSKKEGQS